ncbi:hypothetical protein Tco_1556609 [Tanacetum coccineum]
MADLIFANSHNMVAYLEKSEDNVDFAKIVDFLNVSPIRYTLTVSPTVYVSYIEQFWFTLKIKTVNNETQIRAKVDGKTIVISETSVRRDLHFNDEDGITCLTNTEIFKNLQLIGSKSTAWNEFGTNIASAVICLAKKQKFNFSKLIFDVEGEGSGQPTEPQHTPTTISPSHVEPIPTIASSSQPKNIGKPKERPLRYLSLGVGSGGSPRRQDTMGDRPAQTRFQRVLDLENVKDAQASEIKKLKKRVKKLESKKKSRTPQLKRRLFKVRIESSTKTSLGDPEDAFKQKRNEIDQDEGISWFQEDSETQGRYGHDIKVNTAGTSITTASINITTAEPVTTANAPVTTAGVSISTAKPSTPPTTTTPIEDEDLTITQTLMKMKSEKSKAKGVTMQEPSESGTRVRVPPPQIDPKDKGKAKMVEPEKPKKKKDQIEYDADVAQRLQAELDEEARLEREREEEASKAANIAEWDDVQAMMDADYELAAKLQAEEQGEISIEERSKLFVELMNERKKHFARLRAEEQRRKPPTKTQKRNLMSTYLKNMAGYKHTQLKNKSFEEIQMLFEKEMKRVNIFVDMDAELVKGSETIESEVDRAVPELAAGSSKRDAEEELDQESSKRQKTGESSELAEEPRDKEADELSQEELQQMMIIVPEQGMNVAALQTKYPIIDWEIYIEGTRKYRKIIQVGNHTEVHHFFNDMLKAFDRDDLVMLWSLVKEKFNSTKLTDDKEREIWVELKRLFEPDINGELWKLQKHIHDLTWKLYDSCGVNHVSTEKGIDIYMLVEKEYPLSRGTLTLMLVAKLLVEQDNEMSRELRKIFMQAERTRR